MSKVKQLIQVLAFNKTNYGQTVPPGPSLHITIKSVQENAVPHSTFFPLFFSCGTTQNKKDGLVVAMAMTLQVLTPNIFDAQLFEVYTQRTHTYTHTQTQVYPFLILLP